MSQHQSQSNEKSLEQFDYEKAVSNYLGTQSTFKGEPAGKSVRHRSGAGGVPKAGTRRCRCIYTVFCVFVD